MSGLSNKFVKVITSMGRAETIAEYTLPLMPDALVCVPANEVDDYAKVIDRGRILGHPTGLNSHAAAINWVLDTVLDEVVWSFDDDLKYLVSYTGRVYQKYTDPEVIDQVLDNTIEMARGVGARLCGFNISMDVKAYNSQQPFKLWGMVNGSSMAFIGRDIKLDVQSGVNCDADLVLQHLLKYRVIFVDTRFCFHGAPRNTTVGGSAAYRSDASYQRGRDYMERKWGKYVSYSMRQGAHVTSIRVKRQQ